MVGIALDRVTGIQAGMAAQRLGTVEAVVERWRVAGDVDSNPFPLLELLDPASRDVTGRRLLQGAGQQRRHIRASLGPHKFSKHRHEFADHIR